jgi:hypothetical protein
MKKIGVLGFVALFGLLGCTTQRYSRVETNGTRVNYTVTTWFNNSWVRGLNIDSETKTTKTGVKIASSDNEVNSEAIKTFFEALTEGAVKGAVKGASGKP